MRLFIFLILILPKTALTDTLNCPCKVVEVIDGDTVFVLDQFRSSRKIWLAGIDAPELDQPFGEESKIHLAQRVLGKLIEVEYLQRDRYGRIIGKLLKNGLDINLQQLNNGFAWHFKQAEIELTKLDYAIYRSAEKTAKSNGLGLWSFPTTIPPWEHRSGR